MLISTKNVSELIGVNRCTVNRWVNSNKIPYEPANQGWKYFDYKKIIDWLNSKKVSMKERVEKKEVKG